MTNVDPELVKRWKEKIDSMSLVDMGRFYRFAPIGHIVFINDKIFEHFKAKFSRFTPELSKEVGWNARFVDPKLWENP